MRRTAALLLGAMVLLAACGGDRVPTDATNQGLLASTARQQDIKTLRAATEAFKDFNAATNGGPYSAQITPCMEDPTLGGMGFHYGNVGLIDGTVQVDQPELLLYQPGPGGAMTLVAVEYIIPYTFISRDSPPPMLFGEKFQQVDAFQLWGLHAWVWKRNPSGLFAPWNPTVSCASSTTPVMSHH